MKKLGISLCLLITFTVSTRVYAQDHSDDHRVYDKKHKDYHQWNADEDQKFHEYLKEKHSKDHDWKSASTKEQAAYWDWRHNH